MGRRSDHTRKEIKDMAIKAGLELIEKHGFSKFSTRILAKKIGYSVGTLYNVFKNFDDIIFHINAITLEDLKQYVESNLNGIEGIEAIKNIGCSYIDYSFKYNARWNALFEYIRPPASKIPDWYLIKMNSLLAIPEQFLLPLFKGDSEKARSATRILWGGVHGICSLGYSQRLDANNSELLKAMSLSLIENYLKGLTKASVS